MNETQKNLLYLLSCAVNGMAPDKEKVQGMDLEKLHHLAVTVLDVPPVSVAPVVYEPSQRLVLGELTAELP